MPSWTLALKGKHARVNIWPSVNGTVQVMPAVGMQVTRDNMPGAGRCSVKMADMSPASWCVGSEQDL